MGTRYVAILGVAIPLAMAVAPSARAVDVSGTVQLQGTVVFAAPIPGITASDLQISVRPATEATGNGEKCSIQATTTDTATAGGAYPDAGTVSATILLERGGPHVPDGTCIVTVEARGTDGSSVSARGVQTIFVGAAEIGGNATVPVPAITVRESKAISGVSRDCVKWTKKQLIKRGKCNFLLLKKGAAAAAKCKDGGLQPAGCDPGAFTEAVLALSHGDTNQQLFAGTAQAVDPQLQDQILCQKRLGKGAAKFVAQRIKLVQKECIDAALDSPTCRNQQSKAAKKKLEQIDKCSGSQMIDGATGIAVPDAGPPCDACIDGGGSIDKRCLKACFLLSLGELSDGILGDLPQCGDGIVQPGGGEFCDDGNTTGGDGCSATCTLEGP